MNIFIYFKNILDKLTEIDGEIASNNKNTTKIVKCRERSWGERLSFF